MSAAETEWRSVRVAVLRPGDLMFDEPSGELRRVAATMHPSPCHYQGESHISWTEPDGSDGEAWMPSGDMVFIKPSLADKIAEVLVSQHPFTGGKWPEWFRDWITAAAPAAATYVREHLADHAHELGFTADNNRFQS